MQYSEGKIGRVFTLRLEDGDRLPDVIEQFAREHDITGAACWMVGGVGGGTIVVGPRDSHTRPPDPMTLAINGAHEVTAFGTIFPGPEGGPVLHMHAAMGREGKTRTGCIRPGIDTWVVLEVVIMEITGANMARTIDPETGFALLTRKG